MISVRETNHFYIIQHLHYDLLAFVPPNPREPARHHSLRRKNHLSINECWTPFHETRKHSGWDRTVTGWVCLEVRMREREIDCTICHQSRLPRWISKWFVYVDMTNGMIWMIGDYCDHRQIDDLMIQWSGIQYLQGLNQKSTVNSSSLSSSTSLQKKALNEKRYDRCARIGLPSHIYFYRPSGLSD